MQPTVFTTIFHIFIFVQSCQAILSTNAKSNVALYWVRQIVQSVQSQLILQIGSRSGSAAAFLFLRTICCRCYTNWICRCLPSSRKWISWNKLWKSMLGRSICLCGPRQRLCVESATVRMPKLGCRHSSLSKHLLEEDHLIVRWLITNISTFWCF